MSVIYGRGGGDLACNITVGNGIGCRVAVELFDARGDKVSGPKERGFFLDAFVQDDPAPEYVIPAAILAEHEKLTLLHQYRPLNWAGGAFEAICKFDQDDVDRGADLTYATPEIGGVVYRRIRLESK